MAIKQLAVSAAKSCFSMLAVDKDFGVVCDFSSQAAKTA
jgi:hypothetical protein